MWTGADPPTKSGKIPDQKIPTLKGTFEGCSEGNRHVNLWLERCLRDAFEDTVCEPLSPELSALVAKYHPHE